MDSYTKISGTYVGTTLKCEFNRDLFTGVGVNYDIVKDIEFPIAIGKGEPWHIVKWNDPTALLAMNITMGDLASVPIGGGGEGEGDTEEGNKAESFGNLQMGGNLMLVLAAGALLW